MNEVRDRGRGWTLPSIYRKSYAKISGIRYEDYQDGMWVLYSDVGDNLDELEIINRDGEVIFNKKIKKK